MSNHVAFSRQRKRYLKQAYKDFASDRVIVQKIKSMSDVVQAARSHQIFVSSEVISQYSSLLRIAYPAVGDDIGRFSLRTIYAYLVIGFPLAANSTSKSFRVNRLTRGILYLSHTFIPSSFS